MDATNEKEALRAALAKEFKLHKIDAPMSAIATLAHMLYVEGVDFGEISITAAVYGYVVGFNAAHLRD